MVIDSQAASFIKFREINIKHSDSLYLEGNIL